MSSEPHEAHIHVQFQEPFDNIAGTNRQIADMGNTWAKKNHIAIETAKARTQPRTRRNGEVGGTIGTSWAQSGRCNAAPRDQPTNWSANHVAIRPLSHHHLRSSRLAWQWNRRHVAPKIHLSTVEEARTSVRGGQTQTRQK